MSRDRWFASRPAVSLDSALALAVWAWCKGWDPALIPTAAAYYGAEDMEMLVELLLAMREAVDAHAARLREGK